MEKKKMYKPSQFARLIGVHVKTLQRWDKAGILVAKRTITNRRYYTDEDYENYRKGRSRDE